MSGTFQVSAMADAGDFADGDSAALAWDVLHRTASHDLPDRIDLSECIHLKPYAVACLCALAELAVTRGRSIELVPPRDAGCAEHLSRLGLPGFFAGNWATSAARPTNIAIRRVTWPPGSEGQRIVEVLAPCSGLPPGIFPRMVEGLDEIVLNGLTHSGSPVDCIVAGQAFPSAAKIEVVVLDLGRTIHGHLTSNPAYATIRTDEEAILKAAEEGVTGTPAGQRNSRGELNSGAGLSFLREYCESGGGELTLLSGRAWVTFRAGLPPVTGRFRSDFQGCLVNIRYFTGKGLPTRPAVPIL